MKNCVKCGLSKEWSEFYWQVGKRLQKERLGQIPMESDVNKAVVFYTTNAEGNILAVRRKNGKYALPGGKVEPGETLAKAVSREVLEETGLVVDYSLSVWEINHPADGPQGKDFQVTYYLGSVLPGPLHSSEDTTPSWISRKELAAGNFWQYNSHVIRIADDIAFFRSALARSFGE